MALPREIPARSLDNDVGNTHANDGQLADGDRRRQADQAVDYACSRWLRRGDSRE